MANLLLMAEFACNNAKNASTSHILFKHNCEYQLRVLFDNETNSCRKSHSANELAEELIQLIEICYQNLLHRQEMQKKTYNKALKNNSYTSSENIRLNKKYIKMKQNQKHENEFFSPFYILNIVRKQAHQLELLTKQKIYNIFDVSQLDEGITLRKRQVIKLPKPEKEFELGNNKKYKVESIVNSAVYDKEAESYMPNQVF